MSNRDIFSKHLPNIRLATRFDADGKEIQVEIREDEEQNVKQLEIFDILVAAGYFRAKIKGITPFDKIVGGMTWCIEACDFDVDVDLLFHENLTIGQKISLTEKIVAVLLKMKCPFLIEPHQIQGLDYINIFPVIQWLVKRSVENRAEKSEKLKKFACEQFHNHFALSQEKENREKYRIILEHLKKVLVNYGPKRMYRRKETSSEDEITRVRVTLLEYGKQSLSNRKLTENKSKTNNESMSLEDNDEFMQNENEIDVELLFKNLALTQENDPLEINLELSETEKNAVTQAFNELKSEMSIDSRELSEQNKIKSLLTTKTMLQKKLDRVKQENLELENTLKSEIVVLEQIKKEQELLKSEIEVISNKKEEKNEVYEEIQKLVEKNEQLKTEELQFRDSCKKEAARLQEEIQKAENIQPDIEIEEYEAILPKHQENLKAIRLQLAKQNRGILTIQRQLDNIPGRTELAQYQRRFIELYNQISTKHKETKQFYTLYNSLEDTKLYLTKELSMLHSIFENYNEALTSQYSMDEYLKQFEKIVEGIKHTKLKFKMKCDDEKTKRDGLNEILLALVEQERRYANIVKQLTKECQKNENLQNELKILSKK